MIRSRPLFLFLALLFLFTSCKKGFDKYYSNTGPAAVYAYDKLKQDSNFSIFAQGLEKTGLVNYINSGGLYTIFAPVNNAWRQYFASKGYGSLNDVPSDTLFRLLNFHIVNNLWYYYSLQQQYATYQTRLFLTRGMKFVTIDVTSPDTLKINGVSVIKRLRDISSDNAVIHGIGSVLIPLYNLEQVLKGDQQLAGSTFYQLMQVIADSAYDRFNSFDRNGDGKIDSAFYRTYSLLPYVYTSLEFRQNTTTTSQGGAPVFTTILMPVDDSLNALIAPGIAKVSPSATNKIAALSPTYVQAVLGPYFIYDTLSAYSSSRLINRPSGTYYTSVDGSLVPTLTAGNFVRMDIPASNGAIHVLNRNFPQSDRLKSGLGQASMDPDLSLFMAALQTAGLMSSLETTARVGTYFAPTNEAITAAGLDVKRMTLNGVTLTPTQFQNILKNHVIDVNLSSSSAMTGSMVTDFGNSNTLTFSNSGTNVTTSLGVTANVTLPAVAKGSANNGYVYKVDQILVPNQY
jgi:uncharacterized surface protein with fasciclin (FAS1) repeats